MQSVREEGSYANGRVHVELLPAEVYGPACEKQFSLRRLGAVLTEAETDEHLQKEMLKVGSCDGWLPVVPLPPPLLFHAKCQLNMHARQTMLS